MKDNVKQVVLLQMVFTVGVFLLLVPGCVSTSSGPNPRSLVKQADKAFTNGDLEAGLRNMQLILDTTPWVLDQSRYSDAIKQYRDAQIEYGFQQARNEEASGNYVKAWVWYVQTSMVDPDREECTKAIKEAQRLRQVISTDFANRAVAAASAGDSKLAASYALRSLWYADNEDAKNILSALEKQSGNVLDFSSIDRIKDTDVAGTVRTDSLQKLSPAPTTIFAPFGLPIYFGDIPKYYQVLGPVQVKGVLQTQELAPEYAQSSSLYALTNLAQKLYNPDALINVTYETTTRNAFTVGTAVRFIEPADANGDEDVVRVITDLKNRPAFTPSVPEGVFLEPSARKNAQQKR